MPNVKRSSIVPFSARQLYDIILDVTAYPEFLPWCESGYVFHQDDHWQQARLSVSYKGFHQSFTTNNELQSGTHIHMTLKDGPFKTLNGNWRFTVLDAHACEVSFDLQFEFRNFFLARAASRIFQQIATQQLDAFVARARDIHG